MIKFNPYPFNAIYDNTRQNRIGKLSTTLRQKHMVLSVIRVLYFIISLFHKYTNLQKQIYVETIFTLKNSMKTLTIVHILQDKFINSLSSNFSYILPNFTDTFDEYSLLLIRISE